MACHGCGAHPSYSCPRARFFSFRYLASARHQSLELSVALLRRFVHFTDRVFADSPAGSFNALEAFVCEEAIEVLLATSKGPHVEVISAPELPPEAFGREFMSTNSPVLIEGLVSSWPVVQEWTSGRCKLNNIFLFDSLSRARGYRCAENRRGVWGCRGAGRGVWLRREELFRSKRNDEAFRLFSFQLAITI